jgi:hypothetical protein
MQVNGKILAAFIGCFMSVSQGMIYEPFATCAESAKVDSIQEWIWVDSAMGSAPPPYRSLYTVAYQPGTCLPARDFFKGYWMEKPNIGTFTLRPGTGTVDYVVALGDGTRLTGTTYFRASGKMDSTEYTENVRDRSGKIVMQTTRSRFLAKSGYELAQVLVREGTGPWTQVQQDSIVPNDAGKTVYSKGEVNAVTPCVADGNTYACTPVGTGSSGELPKQVWYLTGERVDSLRYYDPGGVLLQTDKWFWSGRAATRAIRKARIGSPRTAGPGTAFDVAGRKLPEPDRSQPRFRMVRTRKE